MTDDPQVVRAKAAFAQCTRILSGRSPVTIASQLETLSGSGYDVTTAPDVYGDGIVGELETRVAGLLDRPAAAFFPSGTMAQQVALRIWAGKSANPTVAMHPLHHPEMFERMAYSTLTGLRSVWPTTESRQPTGAEIRATPEPFGTLLIELPLREAGFVLPTWDELVDMTQAARDRGARVHIDGARLWESTPRLAHDLPAIAALADSVYLSFYKSLGGLSGAILAGDEEFVATARAWRHRYGGQIFTQWPTVLSALVGLDRELPRLPDYVAHAPIVAAALARLPGATVYPNPPHTHQFQLWLPHPAEALAEATVRLAEDQRIRFIPGWRTRPPGDRSVAEVTVGERALDWSGEDIVAAGLALLDRLPAA